MVLSSLVVRASNSSMPLHPIIPIEKGEHRILQPNDVAPYKALDNGILGHTNTSLVEAVQDIYSGEIYARKTISLVSRERSRRQKIFDAEAENIQSLAGHHHIIEVFATYYQKPKVHLILKPVAEGGDLGEYLHDYRELVDSGRPEDIKRAQEGIPILERAFGCLANGLSFMHQKRIRHKDVKSTNILLHHGYVIYTDFGLSTQFSQASGSTSDGASQGFTRRYSAPEVIAQNARNSKSDVYSLGCVYLEIIAVLKGIAFQEDLRNLRKVVKDSISSEGKFLDSMAELAVSMTLAIPSERPSSSDVKNYFRKYLDFLCQNCKTSLDTDSTSVPEKPTSLQVPGTTSKRPAPISVDARNEIANPIELRQLPSSMSQRSPKNPIPTGRAGDWRPLLQPPSWPQPTPMEARAAQRNIIAGTPEGGWYERLDSSYRMRTDVEAREFFRRGKVFSMLYHEAETEEKARIGPNSDANSDTWATVVRHGAEAWSQIRRFVVLDVSKDSNWVYACSITTYSGKGALDDNCIPSEHTIVYFTGTEPRYLEGERKAGMSKEPIEIHPNPAIEGLEMDPASRLRFSKTYAIEWNVRVRDIGWVDKIHFSNLTAYWMEFSGEAC